MGIEQTNDEFINRNVSIVKNVKFATTTGVSVHKERDKIIVIIKNGNLLKIISQQSI